MLFQSCKKLETTYFQPASRIVWYHLETMFYYAVCASHTLRSFWHQEGKWGSWRWRLRLTYSNQEKHGGSWYLKCRNQVVQPPGVIIHWHSSMRRDERLIQLHCYLLNVIAISYILKGAVSRPCTFCRAVTRGSYLRNSCS